MCSHTILLKQSLENAEDHAGMFRDNTDKRIVQLQTKIDQDKELLKALKDSYRSKLEILEQEKQTIVSQTQAFAKGLD